MLRSESALWSAGFTKDWWKGLSPEERASVLDTWSDAEVEAFVKEWRIWAHDYQLAPTDPNWKLWVLLMGRGTGKALALDTPIPTPTGWTTMGEIQTGDQVFDETGAICNVEKAHDVLLERDCYAVRFSDGSEIVADGEHLWLTECRRARKAEGRRRPGTGTKGRLPQIWPEIRTTREIADTLVDAGERNHSVPVTQALRTPNATLPIEPYLFGAWLGDGTSRGGEITTADPEMIEEFIAAGEPVGKPRPAGGKSMTYPITEGYVGSVEGRKRTFTGRLRILGVLGNKHIPVCYLRASSGQRLSLLQGLMDTDGYSGGSSAEFCTTRRALAEGVFELVASLGMIPTLAEGVATLNGEVCGPKYRVSFRPREDVFRLARKRAAVNPFGRQACRSGRRFIIAVERVHSVPVRCITVDSESHLYLAGRAMIPTHNTRTAVETVRDMIYQGQAGRVCLLGQGADDVRDVMVEGEALALDTPIPTPTGWTAFGDLQPGDEIFARDGSVTRVAGVTPIWNDRPCYALTADGADPIVADERHLWVTSSRAERRPDRSARGESVRTTGEIAGEVRKRRADLCEHEIPMGGALDLPEADLPVPPYTLGAWLGDGDTRGQGNFTCHVKDQQIVDEIRADGFEVRKWSGLFDWGIQKLKCRLAPAGLVGRKHVPAAYMRASAAQRLALLQGLMDTDGYVSDRGQCAFDNTNLELIEAVRELLLTLGFKPREIKSRKPPRGETMFRLTFTGAPGLPAPFRLKRKVDRCIAATRPAGRLVRSVDLVDSVPVRCIQVEHPSGTFLAGRDFVVTHNSGFLATAPSWFRPVWAPSRGTLEWPNGALGYVYSMEDPEALRGPQFDLAWIDEIMAAKADARQKAESNLRFGLRLGRNPKRIYTTTPKPHKWIRDLVKRIKEQAELPDGTMSKGLYITRGSTYENQENLPDSFLEDLRDDYEGTRLGRQELYGEILGDTEGALFQTGNIDANRIMKSATEEEIVEFSRTMERIIVAVDPNMKAGQATHAAGITVHGLRGDKRYLLADRSIRGASPEKWGREVCLAAHDYQANEIIAEVNQGGDLVRSVINAQSGGGLEIPPVRNVHASRGKQRRAEPVAAAYEQNKVKHVGSAERYEKVETQLTELHENEDPTGEDFDRADSVVWGQTWLARKGRSASSSGAGPGIMTMADFGAHAA